VPKITDTEEVTGSNQRRRPLRVRPGESPYLVSCQSKISKCHPERLTGIYRAQELLTQLDWEPLLCPGSAECFLSLGVRSPARCAAAAGMPACGCAVCRSLSHAGEGSETIARCTMRPFLAPRRARPATITRSKLYSTVRTRIGLCWTA
jgi:hypothetical protein